MCSAEPLRFVVTISPDAFDQPFTGRVVVWLSHQRREPRFGPNWFHPEPCYSAKFTDVKPGDPMTIDAENSIGFPGKLSELEPGEWSIQAVADRNLGGRTVGGSPGNLYSKPVRVAVDPKTGGDVKLTCDQVVTEPKFTETAAVKRVRIKSKLLSDFHKRDTFMQAVVILPVGFETHPDERYPVIYSVPGFGGSIQMFSGRTDRGPTVRDHLPFLFVFLDANCPTGHSVFAESDNNGPWGKALTTELIPEIESKFRAIAKPEARFVTGHSSGGWSSLWLQVTYPDFFGGCWSTSPDPVDFRDFQQIDLYKPNQNLFTDENGNARPLARQGDQPFLFYKSFTQMEQPIRGEQIGSFEAVFGPRGPDGEPARMYDRNTGAIDPKVIESWKRYDIGLILRTHWKELSPKLAGKIHVYIGDMDTFYLDGAVRLLQADMKTLNADAVIELVPGDHGTMMTPQLHERIDREMADQFRKSFPSTQPSAKQPATRKAA